MIWNSKREAALAVFGTSEEDAAAANTADLTDFEVSS